MNVNLLGEVYQDNSYGTGYYLHDKSKDRELYYKVKQRPTVLVYPVFTSSDEFQIVYEARDSKAYHKLTKDYNNKVYGFSELSVTDYCDMFKRRLSHIEQNTLHETFMIDFKRASDIGIIREFPKLQDNIEFNRIFKDKIIGSNLVVTDNYVKVVLDRAYQSNSDRVVIKRMPERKLEFYTVSSPCTTEIKFKTTDIVEIIKLCNELELVEHYYRSELFQKDIETKLETALSLISNGNYNESLCYRLLSVFGLAMYRSDITSKLHIGKDLITNIVLENKNFLTEFIETASKYLQQDVLKYLKGIYLKSEYRCCY